MEENRIQQPVKKRQPRRWWPIPAIVGGALALIFALYFLAIQPAALRYARSELDEKVAELSAALGRTVSIGELTSSLTDDIVLDGVQIASLDKVSSFISVGRVRLDFSLWDVLMGRRQPARIRAEGCRIALRMEQEGFPEVVDFVKGLKRYQERHPHDATRSASEEGLGDALVTGCVVELTTAGTPGPMAVLREVSVEAHRVERGTWEIGLSGMGHGVADRPVPFSGVATLARPGSVYLNVDFDAPVSPALFLGNRIPADVWLTGLTVQASQTEGMLGAAVRGVQIGDTSSLLQWDRLAGYVKSAGAFSADTVAVTLLMPSNTNDNGFVDRLNPRNIQTVTVRNMSFQFTPRLDRLGMLQLKSLDLDGSRDAETGDLQVRLDGGGVVLGSAFTRLTALLRVSRDFAFRSGEARISGPLLPHIISAIHPRFLAWNGAEMNVSVSAQDKNGDIVASGQIEGRGLTYFWTKLCLVPITDIAFDMDFDVVLNLKKETLKLTLDPISVQLARFAIDFELSRFTQPKFRARFYLPKQSCQALATAVPPVMVPRLHGAVMEGSISFDLEVTVDLKTSVVSSLRVDADTESCHALTLGTQVDIDSLNGPFVHTIVEEDLDEPILVGPGTSKYIELDEIPEVIRQEALATEDMGFYRHKGFKLGLIKRAAMLNLEKGWFVYGGSTISQQLVKNLFLSREKTLARKFEEAIIVWEMERLLDKDRILELYLNCIEFGRHIYGIKDAAKVYFNKEPRDLLPLEGAFLMATKPSPRYAFNIYRKREFNEWWVERMRGILNRLWQEMGVIDEDTFVGADPYLPTFYYKEDDSYQVPRVNASTLTPPGMPKDLPREDKGTIQPIPGETPPVAPPTAGTDKIAPISPTLTPPLSVEKKSEPMARPVVEPSKVPAPSPATLPASLPPPPTIP